MSRQVHYLRASVCDRRRRIVTVRHMATRLWEDGSEGSARSPDWQSVIAASYNQAISQRIPTPRRERIRRALESLRPPEHRYPAVVLMWVLSIALALVLVVELTGIISTTGSTTDSSSAPVMQLNVYSAETGKLLGHCRAQRVEGTVIADPRPGSSEVARCTGLGAKPPGRTVIVEAARWYPTRPGVTHSGP